MKELFSEYNILINEDQIEKLEKYYELLIYYNNKFNITTITEKEEVYKKHFIDSMLGRELLKSGKLIDIGSGGGFPAIPLKILNDNLDVTLVEATEKKCDFLNKIIENLEIKNIKVINGRAEELAQKENFREKFDYCTARAVASLNILCEYCLPFVKKEGYFIAYKGKAEEEIKNSEKALLIIGGKIENIIEKKLDGAERQIINIKKIKNTEKIYPRKNAKIRKNPL